MPSAVHAARMTGSNLLTMPHDVTSIDAMIDECTDTALSLGHVRGHAGLMTLPTARSVSTPGGFVSSGSDMTSRMWSLPATMGVRRSVPMALSTCMHR